MHASRQPCQTPGPSTTEGESARTSPITRSTGASSGLQDHHRGLGETPSESGISSISPASGFANLCSTLHAPCSPPPASWPAPRNKKARSSTLAIHIAVRWHHTAAVCPLASCTPPPVLRSSFFAPHSTLHAPRLLPLETCQAGKLQSGHVDSQILDMVHHVVGFKHLDDQHQSTDHSANGRLLRSIDDT